MGGWDMDGGVRGVDTWPRLLVAWLCFIRGQVTTIHFATLRISLSPDPYHTWPRLWCFKSRSCVICGL